MSVGISVVAKTTDRITLQLTVGDGYRIDSVTRTDLNGTWTVRAEAGALPSTIDMLMYDHEYPLVTEQDITYTVYASKAGSPQQSAVLVIDSTSPYWNTRGGLVHLTVPLQPSMGYMLNDGQQFEASTIVRWNDTRAGRHTVHPVIGRTDPVVVMQRSFTRSGSFDLLCPDLSTAQQVQRSLAMPMVYLLRQSDQKSLGLYFVPISVDLTHGEDNWKREPRPERQWTVAVGFQEVGWPTGYVVPTKVWTFGDLAESYPDFNVVAATFTSFATLLEREPK